MEGRKEFGVVEERGVRRGVRRRRKGNRIGRKGELGVEGGGS